MSRKIKTDGYSIHLSDDFRSLGAFLRENRFSETVLLADENTRAYCLPLLLKKIPALETALTLEIPAGENFKTIDTCRLLWETMLERSIDRSALFINLGGGVVSDLGGFTAAAYKRGIAFINIPTTLLAQVDATIGGKLGVDFHAAKNVIGFFKNPGAVFIHPAFLETLPEAQLSSGFAEMLKHALISSPAHWEIVKSVNPLRVRKWEGLIAASLLVKKKIVEKDPYEKNIRKALNFGHTLGHAFESAALHEGRPLLHGHAVALGMMCETYLSHRLAQFPEKVMRGVVDLLLLRYRKYFETSTLENGWRQWLAHDKKNAGGNYNFTLLKSIGKPQINVHCADKDLREAVDFVKKKL